MLPLWMLNKWTVRGGAVALAVLAVLAWGWMQKRAGREEGKQQQRQDSAAELHTLREQDRAATAEQVAQIQSLVESYKAAYERSAAREGALAQAVSSLAQQRATVTENVSRLPDSALYGYIVQQLNLRPVGDLTAGYTPAEERELARCVSDRPLCEQQVKKQEQQIAELREGQNSQAQQIAAQEQRFDVLETYTGRLEGYYITLANLYPRKARSGKCIWLWKCATKKLPTPEPTELKKEKQP